MVMKAAILWDIALFGPFEGTYEVALWFLVQLIFDTEDGGDTYLRNFDFYKDITTLYPKRWQLLEVL
jgi:hypothetical protein